jgi:homoaconitase/3-isopropylmalate dehydratase large subunit
MGARTLWEKLAPPTDDDGQEAHVPLDAVLPTQRCAPLRAFYDSTPFYSDPTAETDWAYPAQRYLDSGLAAYGARVATCDPHALELGAFGIAAFHHAPAALVTRGRDRHQPVGQARRTLVRLNDALPPGCDPVDAALRLGLEAGLAGLSSSVLTFEGDGVDRLGMGGRRRLLASAAVSGCLTAFGPLDEQVRQEWWRLPVFRPPSPQDFVRLRPDPEARHDEILVVNAGGLEPLALSPRPASVVPVARLGSPPLERVAIGGCVGGDPDSLLSALEALEARPPRTGVEVHLVPASEGVLQQAESAGWHERARRIGVHVSRPSTLPASLDASTSSCLGEGFVASPPTLVASAHEGCLTAWREP